MGKSLKLGKCWLKSSFKIECWDQKCSINMFVTWTFPILFLVLKPMVLNANQWTAINKLTKVTFIKLLQQCIGYTLSSWHPKHKTTYIIM